MIYLTYRNDLSFEYTATPELSLLVSAVPIDPFRRTRTGYYPVLYCASTPANQPTDQAGGNIGNWPGVWVAAVHGSVAEKSLELHA